MFCFLFPKLFLNYDWGWGVLKEPEPSPEGKFDVRPKAPVKKERKTFLSSVQNTENLELKGGQE